MSKASPKAYAAALEIYERLVATIPDLKRKDITAKSWAYTYRFIGRPTSCWGTARETCRTTSE